MFLAAPRGFRDSTLIEHRRQMLLNEPTVQPLREWASNLSQRRNDVGPTFYLPDFDPAEAGVEARVLIVLEAPGPMTNPDGGRVGSGFVSVDNNDGTAENLWNLRNEVGLHHGTLLWNIVPWYLGAASVKPKAADRAQGAKALRDLMDLLPDLRVVVLCGHAAREGWNRNLRQYRHGHIEVIPTWHPAPLAMKQPGKREELLRDLARASLIAR